MKLIVGLWLALIASTASAQPAGKDLVELVAARQMPVPVPPAANDAAAGRIAQFLRAYEIVQAAVEQPPRQGDPLRVHRQLSTLRLVFAPATFRGTLVAAVPAGTVIRDAWTGVDRYYRIGAAGKMQLSELDLGATGGKFYMLEQMVNAHIGARPAIFNTITAEGAMMEEIVWVSGSKLYMLTYVPELVPGSGTKADAGTSAYSLAQELR